MPNQVKSELTQGNISTHKHRYIALHYSLLEALYLLET